VASKIFILPLYHFLDLLKSAETLLKISHKLEKNLKNTLKKAVLANTPKRPYRATLNGSTGLLSRLNGSAKPSEKQNGSVEPCSKAKRHV